MWKQSRHTAERPQSVSTYLPERQESVWLFRPNHWLWWGVHFPANWLTSALPLSSFSAKSCKLTLYPPLSLSLRHERVLPSVKRTWQWTPFSLLSRMFSSRTVGEYITIKQSWFPLDFNKKSRGVSTRILSQSFNWEEQLEAEATQLHRQHLSLLTVKTLQQKLITTDVLKPQRHIIKLNMAKKKKTSLKLLGQGDAVAQWLRLWHAGR